jgi:Reductase C-terminal
VTQALTHLPVPTGRDLGEVDLVAARRAAHDLLEALRVDLTDENLRDRPRRMARMYSELLTPAQFRPTTFPNDGGTVGMEYAGLQAPSDQLVVRGSLKSRQLQAFSVANDGRVTAGMHLNEWDALEPIKRLIESGAVVDADRLADPSVPLDEMSVAAAAASTPGET